MTSFFLTGCLPQGGGEKEEFQEFREGIRKTKMTAQIRADLGDRVSDFLIEYSEEENEALAQIIEPSLIGKSAARFTVDGVLLEYEGIVLELGSLDENGLSPMTAIPLISLALKSWQLSDFRKTEMDGIDEEIYLAKLSDLAGKSVKIYLEEDFKPFYAEIELDGKTALYCEIIEWENIEDR
ncbi:hypothetical protein LJC01_01190 [Clostridiaceae bacterium OttesenSCG-928-D20]|nr:hypothetical protein [Clostridiaceae bacterium OttesenSCG-928-D20]